MTGLASRIDAAARSALDERRIVGAVIVVMRDGAVVHHGAYGLADREAGLAMRPDALFRLASITKPIVTTTVMRMIELGQLGLDSAATDFLPDFRPKLANGTAPVITVRQLLTHTAGLAYDFLQPVDGPYARLRVSAGADQPGLSLEENLARIVEAGLMFPPGAKWLYSVAIDVLGAVLQKAGGAALDELVRRHVTDPMGMKETAFRVADRARLAQPYANAAPEPIRIVEGHKQEFIPGMAPISTSLQRAFNTNTFPAGGAGMNGPALEVARFLDAIRAGGRPMVSRTSAAAMMSNQIGPLRILFDPTGSTAFGFGGAVVLNPAERGSPLSPNTWQWGGVWGHSWFVDPLRRMTIVLLTNTMLEGMTGQLPLDVQFAAAS
jgi:CubicO group peptidase (beta-lactamase class C family)